MKKNAVLLAALLAACAISQVSLAQDLANTTLKASNYTIQLIAMDTLNQAKGFIAKHGLQDKAIPVRINQNGKTLYKVVYGDYSSRAEAQAAIGQLPSGLKQARPWVQQFGNYVR